MSRPNLSCGTRHRPLFIGAALIGPVKHTGCLTGSGPAARPAGTRRCDTRVHNENTEYGFRRNLLAARPLALALLVVLFGVHSSPRTWAAKSRRLLLGRP